MDEVACPVCGSTEVIPYVPGHPEDDGDYTCANRDCRAKFVWPQPPAPVVDSGLTPEAIAALQLLRDQGVIPDA